MLFNMFICMFNIIFAVWEFLQYVEYSLSLQHISIVLYSNVA